MTAFFVFVGLYSVSISVRVNNCLRRPLRIVNRIESGNKEGAAVSSPFFVFQVTQYWPYSIECPYAYHISLLLQSPSL